MICGPKSLLPKYSESLGVIVETDLIKALRWCDAVNVLRVQNERMNLNYFPSAREYHNLYGLTKEKLDSIKKSIMLMKYLKTIAWKIKQLTKMTMGFWDESLLTNMQVKSRCAKLRLNRITGKERHEEMMANIGLLHSLIWQLLPYCVCIGKLGEALNADLIFVTDRTAERTIEFARRRDERNGLGTAGNIVTSMGTLEEERVFAVTADAPSEKDGGFRKETESCSPLRPPMLQPLKSTKSQSVLIAASPENDDHDEDDAENVVALPTVLVTASPEGGGGGSGDDDDDGDEDATDDQESVGVAIDEGIDNGPDTESIRHSAGLAMRLALYRTLSVMKRRKLLSSRRSSSTSTTELTSIYHKGIQDENQLHRRASRATTNPLQATSNSSDAVQYGDSDDDGEDVYHQLGIKSRESVIESRGSISSTGPSQRKIYSIEHTAESNRSSRWILHNLDTAGEEALYQIKVKSGTEVIPGEGMLVWFEDGSDVTLDKERALPVFGLGGGGDGRSEARRRMEGGVGVGG